MAAVITPQNAATIAELVRLTDALDAAVDRKDWGAARSLFTDRVDADFQSLTGDAPFNVPADDIVSGWRTNLTAAKTSEHHRSNHQVTLDGDLATVESVAHAWNRMEGNGDPLWEVWGRYTHRFRKAAGSWLIEGLSLKVTHQRGNFWVRDTIPT